MNLYLAREFPIAMFDYQMTISALYCSVGLGMHASHIHSCVERNPFFWVQEFDSSYS